MTKVSTSTNTISYSDTYNITYGTTQGSCLGPLLFILFCNDIHLLPIYGHLILFADNTTLICKHRNRAFLNHDMELLDAWFKANQLSVNMTKTILMTFWDEGNFSVKTHGIEIPIVSCTKFFGVNLDNKLTWDIHVETVYRS